MTELTSQAMVYPLGILFRTKRFCYWTMQATRLEQIRLVRSLSGVAILLLVIGGGRILPKRNSKPTRKIIGIDFVSPAIWELNCRTDVSYIGVARTFDSRYEVTESMS